jgi:hypothetical protein
VAKQQVREYIHVLFAGCPFDGKMVYSLSPTLEHNVIGAFLQRIAVRFPENLCVVFLDCSGPHTDGDLKIPERVRVERLPSKSPELNPAEHIWDHVREKHFGNKLFSSMDEVTGELRHAFRTLLSNASQVRSMMAFPWIVPRTF